MNQAFLRTIFESSGNLRRINLPQEYTLLESYLQRGVLVLQERRLQATPFGIQQQLTEFLATCPHHLWEIEVPKKLPLLATIDNGGGLAHQQLCWLAAAWLLDQGFSVVAEQRFAGKRVDLLTDCQSWLIECGDTAPTPITRHLLRGVTQIGIVPFQELVMPDSITIYIIAKGNAWSPTAVQKDLIIRLESND